MDISKTGGRSGRSSKEEVPQTHGGVRRRTSSDEIRIQFEDLKEKHRVLRHQFQLLQMDRDKAVEEVKLAQDQSKVFWRKGEELKRENAEQKKKLERGGYAPRGQVSRFEHESLAKRFDQVCAQVRMVQHDKEQLEQKHIQEKQDLEGRYLEEMKSLKANLEDAEQEQDNMRYKLSEYKRENERLNEKLACMGPNYDSSKREIDRIIDQRDQLRARVNELKQDNKTLQEKLSKPPESRTPPDQQLRSERDRLTETNTELRGKLETSEGRLRDLEIECQRLRHAKSDRASSPVRQFGRLGDRVALSQGGSEEMLAIKRHRCSAKTKFSQSSTDEDFSDNQHSLTDLTSLTFSDSGHLQHAGGGPSETYTRGLSVGTSKKLSSSTSNLAMASELYDRAVPSHSRLNDQNSRLRLKLTRTEKALEELKKDKQNLTGQISKLESEKKEMETQSHSLRAELDSSRKELADVSGQRKVAHNQIEILTQEKGVAMRDNASSYQQSIQSESKIRELQAEKEILEQQRDIANRERERVITDVVTLRRKLETIKTQRQKDAKELSGMRHLKERAVQELEKLRSLNDQQQEMRKVMEEELASMQEAINRASLKAGLSSRGKGAQKTSTTLSTAEDLQGILERLHALENERKLVHKKLFGPEGLDQPRSLSDVLQKVEGLLQERDSLVVEIEALQESSSKVNEERIFDLKQKIEDLLMERDSLSAQTKNLKREVTSLSSKVVKTEQERDRLLIDCERLELQCEQLKGRQSRLVEEHTKTLERVNELWKQKWPPAWDEAWEEKNVQIPLSVEGFAGFSVVGGRDQPQLPNPGAFIITMVNQNGPADGLIKVGDVLESVNGISLTNADHRDAVRAVKESKGFLNIILRRRRNAYPIQMGIVSAINSVPHLDSTLSSSNEQHEYSLYITSKENLGFRHDWSTMYTVTDVASAGPAHQILEIGDRIIKVNNVPISHEKPSAVRKMMKPHKNILRLVIERSQTSDRSYMGQALHPNNADWSTRTEEPLSKRSSWAHSANSGSSTPNWSKSSTRGGGTQTSQDSRGSYPDLGPNPELMAEKVKDYGYKKQILDTSSQYQPRSRDSYTSRDGYSQDTQESQDSGKPTKLAAVVTCVKRDTNEGTRPPHQRPMSDGMMYGNYNERRIEYEDVLLSERTESQYSQSESYLSESYIEGYGLSSQSIDLTFHSLSAMPQCRLTVDTAMTTQNEGQSQQSEDEDEFGFLARNDASRTTFRNRSASEDNSNANNSETGHSQPQFSESQYTDSQMSESQLSYPDNRDNRKKKGVRRRLGLRSHRPKSNTIHGSRSLTRLTPSGNGYGNLASRGRSLSNISLGHAPSMSSVREEPRRSTSTSNVATTQQCDPLADATYIRANFAYIPHSPKELKVKAGDVFHILDEAPSERFRASFWVSRLSADGTDEQIGAIPNSFRGQEYLEDQGDSLDIPLYEEVEAFTGTRPVLVFGALADQVTASLLEGYPNLFYPCPTDTVEGGVPRLTEVRLKRDVSEGKIVDFWRSEAGFDVIRIEAINGKERKGKHCLLTGSVQAFQSLKGIAPPITILVKAMTEESITTFSPEQISRKQAKEIFDDITSLEEQHGHEFSGSLFLIYMDTLMGQIENIVKKEQRKQAWVPVTKET